MTTIVTTSTPSSGPGHFNLNPFIELISSVIFLINLVLIAWCVLGLLIHFDIVNRYNPLIVKANTVLRSLIEPLLRPIRQHITRRLPDMGGVDISPVILILLLHFINSALYSWFYSI